MRQFLQDVHIDELLCRTVQARCNEFHLRSGQAPYTRFCDGALLDELSEYGSPSPLDVMQMIYAILSDEQIIQLEREGKLIFSYPVARIAKFDVHVFRSPGSMEADFCLVPSRG